MSARTALPVADPGQVRRYAARLMLGSPGAWSLVVALHSLAAIFALAAPALVGALVQVIKDGTTLTRVNQLCLAIAASVCAQAVLVRYAKLASARLGESMLAKLREDFVDRVLAIPLSTVERAGTGDLLTRTSRDVHALSQSVRFAVPEILVAFVTALFAVGALMVVGVRFAVLILLGAPIVWVGLRRYLRLAPAAYLRESAAYSDLTDGLAETAAGARSMEAFGRQRVRIERSDADVARVYQVERYTLALRMVFFPTVELGYLVPVVATLLVGGWYYQQGWAQLWQVTAATLYVQQLVDPLDRLISWLNELQVGQAALARLLGISNVDNDRPTATGAAVAQPSDESMAVTDVRFAYVQGRDVLHGVDLHIAAGERLAMVGPSGAGKSTLGRLLAGVHRPRTGQITVGGVDLSDLPLAELRGEVALVTQEHHVFLGTLKENVALARPQASDAEVWAALRAVEAQSWVSELPDALSTQVGTGALALTPAQAQQVALARLVIADPHTLVLDEATSLIDPRAARRLERSLAAVLAGRTVIAIAHRLFSAHDADRVAVMRDGRIDELGSHAQLMAAGGSYAALWRSWHGQDSTSPAAATGNGAATADAAGAIVGAAPRQSEGGYVQQQAHQDVSAVVGREDPQ